MSESETKPNGKDKQMPVYDSSWGKSYVGTKIVRAEPMDDHTFKNSKGIDTSNMETMGDGYRVQYEDGYISWSPKAVFERCYREITNQEKGMF